MLLRNRSFIVLKKTLDNEQKHKLITYASTIKSMAVKIVITDKISDDYFIQHFLVFIAEIGIIYLKDFVHQKQQEKNYVAVNLFKYILVITK
ncbi:MAG: hypothetical protein ACRC5M_07450 [Anaeroplasmataceae bacterium]